MNTYHNYNMFDGAVLVAERGKIIYNEAFGLANREWNVANQKGLRVMTMVLAIILVQILETNPIPWERVILESIIGKYNAETAVTADKKMKADTAHFYVDWLQMYYLGEKLISTKRYNDARIIAEYNVLEFPDKDYIALSMANIYLYLNRKEAAKRFYKKLLK